jgi:hypothetical protein
MRHFGVIIASEANIHSLGTAKWIASFLRSSQLTNSAGEPERATTKVMTSAAA